MKNNNQKQIVWYFILTLLFSWLIWLPGVLSTIDLIHPRENLLSIINILNWVGGIGPSLIAFLFVFKYEGKNGVQRLFKKVFQFRLGLWYLPTFLIIPLFVVCAHVLNKLIFEIEFPQNNFTRNPLLILPVFFIFLIFQVSEEYGWRGYSLFKIQKKLNPLYSSLIIGSIWAIWHLPMFFSDGFGQYKNHIPFTHFFITLVLVSTIITWVQNKCRGSLLPAFIIHAFINLSGEVLPLFSKRENMQTDFTAWMVLNGLL